MRLFPHMACDGCITIVGQNDDAGSDDSDTDEIGRQMIVS
jgi:hypothetical protein